METDRDFNQYRHRYDSDYILIGRVYYLKEYPGTYFHLVQICENASLRFFSWRPKPLIVFINISDHKSFDTHTDTYIHTNRERNSFYVVKPIEHAREFVGI